MKLLFTLLIGVFAFAFTPKHYATCNTFKCIENHKNQNGQVVGKLQKYTPNKTGKGAGHMFWDYEILLSDGITIPVIEKERHHLDFKAFLGKQVVMKCTFYHGVIIGGGTPEAQAATGWRIDAQSISEVK
jgi:hypothetical protein